MKQTKEYKAWHNMKQRCYNSKYRFYKGYGGRLITVCNEWLTSYDSFYKCMGKAPKGYVLDRIDNNQGYNPENCRWVNKVISSKNRRCKQIIQSKYNYVRWVPNNNKWRAELYTSKKNGKRKSITSKHFTDELEAAEYIDYIIKLHNLKDKILNFPNEKDNITLLSP